MGGGGEGGGDGGGWGNYTYLWGGCFVCGRENRMLGMMWWSVKKRRAGIVNVSMGKDCGGCLKIPLGLGGRGRSKRAEWTMNDCRLNGINAEWMEDDLIRMKV